MSHIREIRLSRGLTQAQVASLAGISASHYAQIEEGRKRPSVHVAIRIAAVLGAEVDRLWAPTLTTPHAS